MLDPAVVVRSVTDPLHVYLARPVQFEAEGAATEGDTADVYLLREGERHYALKIYHSRYQGQGLGRREWSNISRASSKAAPKVVAYLHEAVSGLGRDVLVMERIEGAPLNSVPFDEQIFQRCLAILLELHGSSRELPPSHLEGDRLALCRQTLQSYQVAGGAVDVTEALEKLEALQRYCRSLPFPLEGLPALLHGDLWWDNFLLAGGQLYLLDWLESSRGDLCRDLAQFTIGTLNRRAEPEQAGHYYHELVRAYGERFPEAHIPERMRFYLPLLHLETPFSLPFRYLSWQERWRKDPERFDLTLRSHLALAEEALLEPP